MKKIIYSFIALVSILIVTGCGNEKTLTCTLSSKGTDSDIEEKVVFTFKNDKLYKYVLDMTLKNIKIDNLNKVWPSIKKQFNDMNEEINVAGFKRTGTVDEIKHELSTKMEVNYEQISDKTISENNLAVYKDKTYKELKKYFEETEKGTCK